MRNSPARNYDYLLGGTDNFAVDRRATDAELVITPEMRDLALASRGFLERVVTSFLEQGIDQIIDLGSGLPTRGNVHQVAHRTNPDARIVYVDNDPVVATHARALLDGVDGVGFVRADLRQPGAVLGAAEVTRLIDFDRPVGLLMIAVLHFVRDADAPAELLDRYLASMPPGSRLALSAGSDDGMSQGLGRRIAEHFADVPVVLRTRDTVARWFPERSLVAPGFVPLWDWPRKGADPNYSADRVPMMCYGAVLRS